MTDNRNSIAEALAAVQRNVNEQRMKNSMSNYNSIQEALPRPMGRPAVRPMSAAAAPARPTVDTASIYARHGVGSSDEDNGAFHRAEADIRSAQSAAPASSAAPVRPSQTPRPSVRDPKVLQQQKDLIAKGYNIKADGIMGPKTAAAAKDFGSAASRDDQDQGAAMRANAAKPAASASSNPPIKLTPEQIAKSQDLGSGRNASPAERNGDDVASSFKQDPSTLPSQADRDAFRARSNRPAPAPAAPARQEPPAAPARQETPAAAAPAPAAPARQEPPAAPARQETPAAAPPAAAPPAAAAPAPAARAPRGGGLFEPTQTNSPRTPMQYLGRSLGDASDSVGKALSGVGSALRQNIPDEDKAPKPRLDDYESGGPPKAKKKMSESTLINAFLRLQEIKAGNIFEAAKKAKKDWDGDGKIESEKDEVWGSRFKAAKKAGKMEEEIEQVEEERMSKGRRDALARKTSFTADPPRRLEKPEPKETKSEKMKAYRADRDKHGEMEEQAPNYITPGKDATDYKGRPFDQDTLDNEAHERAMTKTKQMGDLFKSKNDLKNITHEIMKDKNRREIEFLNMPVPMEMKKPGVNYGPLPNADEIAAKQKVKSKMFDGPAEPEEKESGGKKKIKEEVGFSEAEIAHFEAVIARKDQKGKDRGPGDVVDSADLTDEYINEMAQRGVKAGQKRGSYKKKATDLQGNRAAAADAAPDEGSKGVPHVLDQIRHGREDEQGFKQITHPASSLDAPVTKSIHRSELHGFYDAYHNTEKPAAKEKAYGDFLGKHFDGDTRTSAPTSQSVTTDLSKIDKSNLKGGAGKISLGGSKLVGGSKK